MKKLIAVLGLSICAASHAKQVVLDCNGSQTFSVSGNNAPATYKVDFDDELNTITLMSTVLALGCFPTEAIKQTKCECDVTKEKFAANRHLSAAILILR